MPIANSSFVPCPGCRTPLPPAVFNTGGMSMCPSCGVQVYATLFPSLFREPEQGRQGERIVNDTDSACFYHSGKKAAAVCDECGRFLCSLCDIEILGRNLCPACVEVGQKKNRLSSVNTERMLYDDIALALATAPMLLFPLTIITAPMAIYYSLYHWKSPTSIIPRTKARFVAAVVLAVAQLFGWLFFLARMLW